MNLREDQLNLRRPKPLKTQQKRRWEPADGVVLGASGTALWGGKIGLRSDRRRGARRRRPGLEAGPRHGPSQPIGFS
jgi:hypothetical protein